MTKLNYLNDTYLFESTAVFVEMKENEKGKAAILDETIFHPQGGGQPADRGEITSDHGVFLVNDVRLDETGTVWHLGEFKNGEFQKGEKVFLKVDRDRRILNAKLHSAGHLIDCAVLKMGMENLRPTKGFHFPEGPSVEYDGVIENAAAIIPTLEVAVNDLIAQDIKLERKDLTFEEARAQNIFAPPGKPARVIYFTGFPVCGCGGTHVNRTSEIGKVTIRKIKSGKGITKIAYSVASSV
jgi:Ser-tRNA(Ala) deacylase AlaX